MVAKSTLTAETMAFSGSLAAGILMVKIFERNDRHSVIYQYVRQQLQPERTVFFHKTKVTVERRLKDRNDSNRSQGSYFSITANAEVFQ